VKFFPLDEYTWAANLAVIDLRWECIEQEVHGRYEHELRLFDYPNLHRLFRRPSPFSEEE
jgi:hypothetical protein